VEDQLLVVLEYWREYRTQFHIATTWFERVSSVPINSKVEGLLLKSGNSTRQKQLYQNAKT